jgi:hypothetical protein
MKSLRKARDGKGTGRHLSLEQLESRAMMAGSVTVKVEGGSLIVTGDDRDNTVVITQVGNGRYAVTGLDDADGNPTTIRGEGSNGTKIVKGVKNDIRIDMNGGADILGIGNDETDLTGLLDEFINGTPFVPSGSPSLVEVPKNLRIEMGKGDDALGLFVDVGRTADINLNTAYDTAAIEGSSFGDDLLVKGDGGNDNVRIRDSQVHDLLLVNMGDGRREGLEIDTTEARHAELHGGNGKDTFFIDGLLLDRELLVFMGSNDDSLTVANSSGTRADVNGDSGDDELFRGDNDFDTFKKHSFETTSDLI